MISEGKKNVVDKRERFFFLFFWKVFLMGLPSPITPCTSNLHLHSGNIPHCPLPAPEDQSTWVSFFPGSVIPQPFTPLGDTNWHQHVHVAHAAETESSCMHALDLLNIQMHYGWMWMRHWAQKIFSHRLLDSITGWDSLYNYATQKMVIRWPQEVFGHLIHT